MMSTADGTLTALLRYVIAYRHSSEQQSLNVNLFSDGNSSSNSSSSRNKKMMIITRMRLEYILYSRGLGWRCHRDKVNDFRLIIAALLTSPSSPRRNHTTLSFSRSNKLRAFSSFFSLKLETTTRYRLHDGCSYLTLVFDTIVPYILLRLLLLHHKVT